MLPYRQFRAPPEDNGVLIDPGRHEVDGVLRANLAQRKRLLDTVELSGVSAAKIADNARQGLLELARRHTSAYRQAPEAHRDGPLILSGHQPELFHAGVWFKNFLLDSLAKQVGGVGVHLRIDSDLCRDASVRTLSGDPLAPQVVRAPFDQKSDPLPYEERSVVDESLFDSFPIRLEEQIAPWGIAPMARRLWPHATRSLERTGRLGEALSDARHALEGEWGLQTLELPISTVCDTEAFHRFTVELIGRASEFRNAYNGALDAYRTAHRLRTSAQPLPDLGARDQWIETPFWVWQKDDPRRRPLWVRPNANGVELSDAGQWKTTLDHTPDVAVERLASLRSEGIKIRGRALATTLYARLVLSDLFLHGIGGAKYDQVTDDLSERFFGASPPAYLTVSASLWLPVTRPDSHKPGHRELGQRLRDLRFHPEHHVDSSSSDANKWIDQKQRWVRTKKTFDNAAERHLAIQEANEVMFEMLRTEADAISAELASGEARQRGDALRDSREFSFALFPEEDLRERMLALSGSEPAE